jgi:hypothetical protein
MQHYKIKPKIGIGDVKFNSTIEEFINVFNQPDEDELIEDKSENFKSRILHYDDYGLSASFDEESEWKLTSIAVSENDFHLDGNYFIGENKITFLKKIEELNLGEYEKEVFLEEDYTSTLFYFGDLHLSFWFENNELQEIQWGI